MHGYDVFFDYLSIDSGNFENVIIENVKTRAHFIVILTPSALERCKEPGDWLRREIETAMDEKRNIVPLMLDSFDFGSPLVVQALTGKLSTLSSYNGLRVYSEYFFEAMDKLRNRYMNVEVIETTAPSLNAEAKEITEIQKTAANDAPPIEKEQLTAQEWAERASVFFEANNLGEAIRCFSEAIRLEPDFLEAHGNRGIAYAKKGDPENAISDYNNVLAINPNDEKAYFSRGVARRANNDLQGELADYEEAIRLKPDYAIAYFNRGTARSDINDLQGALADYNEAIRLNQDYIDAYFNRATILEKKKSYSAAITDYQKYLDLGGGRQDGDQKEMEEKIKTLKLKITKRKSARKKSK